MANALVFIDNPGAALKKSSLELLTIARSLGETAVAFTGELNDDVAATLGAYGATTVFQPSVDDLDNYLVGPKAAYLAAAVAASGATAVLVDNSPEGKEIAGRLGIKLNAGVITDVVGVEADGTAHKSVLAGSYNTTAKANTPVTVLSVKANNVEPAPAGAGAAGILLRLAGVSHQTVSRVINGSDDVLPETRATVEAAIEQLGYRPNAIARSMARGQTHTLACISPNLTDYTFASVIEGAEVEARQHDYFMLSSSATDPKAFQALVDELVGHRRVDGLIVINPYSDDRFLHLPENFPVVFVGARSHEKEICSVSLDDEKVAYEATRHLISLGHTDIALITGPMEEDCSQDRAEGYRRALQEAGIPYDESRVLGGDWSASSGQRALLSFVEQGRVPTAVFAQNDRMALGVLRAARDVNLKVPSQLAVIGVDDMPLSSYFDPPLTTMRQDMPLIGQEATRMLLELIQKKTPAVRELKLSAQLVVRNSTSDMGGGS